MPVAIALDRAAASAPLVFLVAALVIYEAPFDRCDQEQDYATVWMFTTTLG